MQTLDDLIESLQAFKSDGLDGATRVGVSSRDSNGKLGMIDFDVMPRLVAVAKDEHAKKWTLCRTVSRGGVRVLVIG